MFRFMFATATAGPFRKFELQDAGDDEPRFRFVPYKVVRGGEDMTVRHRIFESATQSWDDLCAEATAFATEVGREHLINISLAASGGTNFLGQGGRGVIVVWYWGS